MKIINGVWNVLSTLKSQWRIIRYWIHSLPYIVGLSIIVCIMFQIWWCDKFWLYHEIIPWSNWSNYINSFHTVSIPQTLQEVPYNSLWRYGCKHPVFAFSNMTGSNRTKKRYNKIDKICFIYSRFKTTDSNSSQSYWPTERLRDCIIKEV